VVAGHPPPCIKHWQRLIRDVSGGGHDYGGIDQDCNEDGERWENDRQQSLAEEEETVWRRNWRRRRERAGPLPAKSLGRRKNVEKSGKCAKDWLRIASRKVPYFSVEIGD
jgi:hypothetical protein